MNISFTFFLLPSSTRNQEDEPTNVVSNDNVSNISSPISFHNLANQQHQFYFFLLPSSTGNQEDEPPNVVSNDNVFCDDSDIVSSSASEELQGEVSPLHTIPAEITPLRTTTHLAATVTTSSPPSLPFVSQPTTPSYTDKKSSAEGSDISNATPPRLLRARIRGGRVRQATGVKIHTRGGGHGHVWGGGNVGRRGDLKAGCDSPKRPKRGFPFTSIPGVHIQSDDPTSPLSILKTFLSDQLIDSIVDFTNRYAEMMMNDPDIQAHMNTKQRSLFHLWRDTNRDEMWLYICICLLMGIIHKPSIHVYWSRQHILSTPIFSHLMRRDGFKQLRKMIHFADPFADPLMNIFICGKDGSSFGSTSQAKEKDMG